MSMPIIQQPENPIDRDQSVNDLIESVALMETGLSHIINAEGEKIQKVVDPDADYTIDDIVLVNNSVEKMVNTVAKLEMMLQSKLETTKEFDTGTQPTPTPIEGEGYILPVNAGILMSSGMDGQPARGEIVGTGLSQEILLNGNPEEFEAENLFGVTLISKDSILKSISALFQITANITNETQIIARLYKADVTSNIYTAIPGTLINLTPPIPIGTGDAFASGSLNDLNISLAANEKIALLFYCTTAAGVSSPSGSVSATINII